MWIRSSNGIMQDISGIQQIQKNDTKQGRFEIVFKGDVTLSPLSFKYEKKRDDFFDKLSEKLGCLCVK
jgi:hypothetical protein